MLLYAGSGAIVRGLHGKKENGKIGAAIKKGCFPEIAGIIGSIKKA